MRAQHQVRFPFILSALVLLISMAGCATGEQATASSQSDQAGDDVETRGLPRVRPQMQLPQRAPVAGSVPAPAATPTPDRSAGAASPMRTQPMESLKAVAPTGPAPTGLVIGGTPLTAQLRWNWNVNAASYVVWRVDGPNAAPVQVFSGWTSSSPMLENVVPDPRITYEYRLVVNYKDGTWGMASASFKSPDPVNPTGFQATETAPATVTLRWNPAPGVVQYRLDGAALPSDGMYLQRTTAEISRVPPGTRAWQLTALYPGNFADYQNRSVASARVRDVITIRCPPTVPAFNGHTPDGWGWHVFEGVFLSAHVLGDVLRCVYKTDASASRGHIYRSRSLNRTANCRVSSDPQGAICYR